jgi:hypothetical protein
MKYTIDEKKKTITIQGEAPSEKVIELLGKFPKYKLVADTTYYPYNPPYLYNTDTAGNFDNVTFTTTTTSDNHLSTLTYPHY